MKRFILTALSICLVFAGTITAEEHLAAVKAKKVITVSGEEIDNGTILIKDDKIEAVGQNIQVPPGYKIYEYADGVVYPGLIDAMTSLGVSGIASIEVVNDTQEEGKYNPQLSIYRAFYPWSNLIPITRQFGTLFALTAPAGGTIPGKAALISLHGWTPEDMFIKKEAALIVRLPESSRKGKKSTDKTGFSKAKEELQDYIAKAHKYYLRAVKGVSQDFNPQYEALKVLWEERMPAIVSAGSAADIKYAIKLGQEFKLSVILYDVYDGEDALPEIKASGYPVILASMYAANKDWEDGCDKVFRLPALLQKQGIKFSFSTGGAAGAFDLPLHAGRAVAYGLSPQEALKALTLYPAEMLGIAERCGSLVPGKTADLVITDGDILETSTLVKDVFIKGKKVSGRSYFQEEYDRAKEKVGGEL